MRFLISAVVGLAILAIARPAAAQVCHVFPPVEVHAAAAGDDEHAPHHHPHHHGHAEAPAPAPHHVIATVAIETAILDGADYQGVTPSLMWHHDWIGAIVSAPAYRLAVGDDVAVGLGDVTVQAHARVVGSERTGAGVAVAVGLPTGRAEDRLGMGHVMAMPGAWGMLTRGRLALLGAAAFGTSVGADAHAHHMHGGFPLVNPMNRRELGGSVRATYAATAALALQATGMVAAPLDGHGITRAAAGLGAQWSAGAWSITGEAQLGLAGDPFRVRGVLGVGRRF